MFTFVVLHVCSLVVPIYTLKQLYIQTPDTKYRHILDAWVFTAFAVFWSNAERNNVVVKFIVRNTREQFD